MMSQINGSVMNQVRAWKDPAYRATLPEYERASLESPIPPVDLMDPSLSSTHGARRDFSFVHTCPLICH
jgi:mersacidin/lichenicidin family type 2 lantibiotic